MMFLQQDHELDVESLCERGPAVRKRNLGISVYLKINKIPNCFMDIRSIKFRNDKALDVHESDPPGCDDYDMGKMKGGKTSAQCTGTTGRSEYVGKYPAWSCYSVHMKSGSDDQDVFPETFKPGTASTEEVMKSGGIIRSVDYPSNYVSKPKEAKRKRSKMCSELGCYVKYNLNIQSSKLCSDETVGLRDLSLNKPLKIPLEKAWKNLLLAIMIGSLFNPAGATRIIPPGQALPGECLKVMREWYGDCPDFHHLDFNKRYENLNTTCCSGFVGKVFHCMMDYDWHGVQFSRFACVRPVRVPAGFGGRFKRYSSSAPGFEVHSLDDSKTHSSSDRQSWEISHAYESSSKSKCDGEGEEMLCRGDNTQDHLCTCTTGYEPDAHDGVACNAGFHDDHSCYCTKALCSPGQCPVRLGNVEAGTYCHNRTVQTLNFTCQPCSDEGTTALGGSDPGASISPVPPLTTDNQQQTSPSPPTSRPPNPGDGSASVVSRVAWCLVVFLGASAVLLLYCYLACYSQQLIDQVKTLLDRFD